MGGLKMDCTFNQDLLQDYFDDTIDPAEKLVVKEHLKECRECAKEFLLMQLMFWDLEMINKTEVVIPAEVSKVRQKVLEELIEYKPNSMGMADLVALQAKNFANAGLFLKYVPGLKVGERYLKKGLAESQTAALKFSGLILKGGFRLIQARIQT
jgi:predicted anti-sigma-YlaC factor YlaD